jgi:hypothetical protein
VIAINKSLEEDIHKQIKELNDLTGEHVETLEFMKNDSIIKHEEMLEKFEGLDVRQSKSEKLANDSDLFGLPGSLHVIRIKLD